MKRYIKEEYNNPIRMWCWGWTTANWYCQKCHNQTIETLRLHLVRAIEQGSYRHLLRWRWYIINLGEDPGRTLHTPLLTLSPVRKSDVQTGKTKANIANEGLWHQIKKEMIRQWANQRVIRGQWCRAEPL